MAGDETGWLQAFHSASTSTMTPTRRPAQGYGALASNLADGADRWSAANNILPSQTITHKLAHNF